MMTDTKIEEGASVTILPYLRGIGSLTPSSLPVNDRSVNQ